MKSQIRVFRWATKRVCGCVAVTRMTISSSVAVVALFANAPLYAETTARDLGETRDRLEKWVETEKVISQEKRDWAVGREVLQERIELVRREIESMREKIAQAEQSITEADKKRSELVEENEALKEASAALEASVGDLEQRTQEVLPRLPDPIRQRIKPLSQRLPDAPSDAGGDADAGKTTKLSLSERFQNVIGILNEVNKFNLEITVTSEVRPLPDGASAEVTAMYAGIGQGYYVGAGGSVGGIGTVSDNGWAWAPANDAAPAITRAVAITKNEEPISFVQLPLDVE